MIREEGWYVTGGEGSTAATMRYWMPTGIRGYWSAPCYVDDPETIRTKARATYGETQDVTAGARVTFEQGYATVRAVWEGMPAAMGTPVVLKSRAEDARELRMLAAALSYNSVPSEAVVKHRLHEIAMRIESGYYSSTGPRHGARPAVSVVVRPN